MYHMDLCDKFCSPFLVLDCIWDLPC